MARKSSSLGPFPKTERWRQIVSRVRAQDESWFADEILNNVRKRLAGVVGEDSTLDAVGFFVALPVVTRSEDPVGGMQASFGIRYRNSLRDTLESLVPIDGVVRRAALGAFDSVTSSPRFRQAQIEEDEWSVWRQFDGPAFCELGRMFYAHLATELLMYYLRVAILETQIPTDALVRHGWELSRITQSFSARWFNACAVGAIPDRGNIRWYLGHCAGKLDLELERELSSYEEPLPTPSRSKKTEPPSLGLPF